MEFNYNKQPGSKKEILKVLNKNNPVISVITPFYSGHEFLEQTANCILNQTYPYFEWIIVNDGRKDKETVELLKKIEKLDGRIKVHYHENSGPAATRDYAVSKTSESTKYLFFIDADDLIDKTYFECAYWTLETNPNASFAYTDCIGFGSQNYLWAKWFTLQEEKKKNMLVLTAMVRKKDFLEVGGYGIKEKGVSEDWNFWLKMFAHGKVPVRMSYYGFWYRRSNTGELALSQQKANLKRTKKIISATLKTIKTNIEAIQYPIEDYDWDETFKANINSLKLPRYEKNKKTKILMIIPWVTMGGADKFNIDLISRIDKEKYEFVIVTTEPGVNSWRQKLEENALIYDLTSFLDRKYWHLFIKNVIESHNIDIIFNTNSIYGYFVLPYLKNEFPNIPIMDYIHMEEWYNRNGGYSRDSSAVSSVIDRTLTCNKKSENILVEYFGRNKKELNTVYIGVDETKFDIKNYNIEQLKEKYKIPNDKFIINYMCRIDAQKRPMLFIEIMRELHKKNQDFICLVAGDGLMLNRLKKKCENYKLNSNIRFLGAIKEPGEIYAISDLSLNCSIKEGLALTAYESLAMGVPVLTSDVGGQSELIDSTVGAVVPCMQKEEDIDNINYSKEEISNYVKEIEKIINNKDKIKKNTRKRILSGFTIDQMVINMQKEFSSIIKKEVKQPNISKDIALELLNQFLLNDEERYGYMCEIFNKQTFGLDNYKKGCTTSKTKLTIIRIIQKIGIKEEIKILIEIFKKFIELFKSIFKKIKKLFRVGSE